MFRWALAGFGVLFLATSDPAFADPPQGLDVASFSEMRTQASALIRDLKRSYAPDSQEYRQARLRYIDAQAAVNAWIEQVKTDIIDNRDIRISASTRDYQQRATAKAQALSDYLHGLAAHGAFPGGASWVGDVASALGDLITQVSLELLRTEDRNRRERLAQIHAQLDGLRWRDFDEL